MHSRHSDEQLQFSSFHWRRMSLPTLKQRKCMGPWGRRERDMEEKPQGPEGWSWHIFTPVLPQGGSLPVILPCRDLGMQGWRDLRSQWELTAECIDSPGICLPSWDLGWGPSRESGMLPLNAGLFGWRQGSVVVTNVGFGATHPGVKA